MAYQFGQFTSDSPYFPNIAAGGGFNAAPDQQTYQPADQSIQQTFQQPTQQQTFPQQTKMPDMSQFYQPQYQQNNMMQQYQAQQNPYQQYQDLMMQQFPQYFNQPSAPMGQQMNYQGLPNFANGQLPYDQAQRYNTGVNISQLINPNVYRIA